MQVFSFIFTETCDSIVRIILMMLLLLFKLIRTHFLLLSGWFIQLSGALLIIPIIVKRGLVVIVSIIMIDWLKFLWRIKFIQFQLKAWFFHWWRVIIMIKIWGTHKWLLLCFTTGRGFRGCLLIKLNLILLQDHWLLYLWYRFLGARQNNSFLLEALIEIDATCNIISFYTIIFLFRMITIINQNCLFKIFLIRSTVSCGRWC